MTYPITTPVIIALILALICLVLSGFFSGSEVAFFSLRPKDIEQLEESSEKRGKQVLEALANSDYLLGTILVMNNFVNIAITMLTSYAVSRLFDFG